ncbi:fumarylacetoacetate hydrolase family protein [Corynebacterium uterequi]|uniref:2-keto-4-pentenoate hydratase/2-oxohepta-3-ene-1,7-dioic acid hydratase n=1 Tax=Corynebacterium uterequi TaxID=1072256 RepID=A0A0G3HCD4_9CORY|nr:fumarylacetoacetate hydrolase family protein [Corynebacterium uterequi]AKK10959.1 2-keto-4-pentenoate hydratase/2-oxohepta-3-ene-1,7-dioic acid hydratase [Corynebacterium uterequi]
MRFARIAAPEGLTFAVVDGDDVKQIAGTPFTEPDYTGRSWELSQVRLLAPTLPSKVIIVDHNRADGGSLPGVMTLKPATAVVGPGMPIKIPDFATDVECSGGLALVIGRPCKNVKAQDWKTVVRGATIGNDVTSRDLLAVDGDATRAKGSDTFCPLGPWIDTDLSALGLDDAQVTLRRTRDGATTAATATPLGADFGQIIEYVTASMTLLPGDVVCVGSSAGATSVEPGDTVTVEIPGLGTLTNPVQKG